MIGVESKKYKGDIAYEKIINDRKNELITQLNPQPFTSSPEECKKLKFNDEPKIKPSLFRKNSNNEDDDVSCLTDKLIAAFQNKVGEGEEEEEQEEEEEEEDKSKW